MRSSARAAAFAIALGLGSPPSAQTPAPPPQAAPAPAPAGAQTPAPAPPPVQPAQKGDRPQPFRAEANFVRVDAYPTKDGKPVLDLQATDFEIAEDGVPQKVDSFEHVVVRPAGAESERIEPNSQRDMLQAAENPRHRVFVIFLDQTHVRFEDSHAITEPLIRLINRMLAPDDLVGVMTPDMSASELVLSRRTEVTEERLRTHWRWGDRFEHMNDKLEDAYEDCYGSGAFGDLAQVMIARKRERETLEALQDLVRYLGGIREERKAILTVTGGWDLFTPRPELESRGGRGNTPSVDPVGVGPDGKLTTKDPRYNNDTATRMECNADRMRLAQIDDERFIRDIVNEANRSNATFYPISPGGLVAFETDICGRTVGVITPSCAPVSLTEDARLRTTHQNAVRSLADGTDGIAVVDTNDLDKGLRRISDDLSSYYLLGYYSTNGKLDGGYRSLKVRVKRPGVEVRARRGYRAASAEEVARSRAAAAAPAVDTATPVNSALSLLASVRPDARVRLRATPAPGSDRVWITGELAAVAGRPDEWGQGATADLQITSGSASASSRVTIKPGDRTFLTSVTLPAARAAAIDVQARVSPTDGGPAALETLRIAATPQPLFYRRGPTTANRQVATGDLRFTRADRVHLELPVGPETKPGAGRLLDRTGQPTPVPVTVGERTDEATGQRWITADVTLAPLAPSDYLVEVATAEPSGEVRILTGIRIVR